jgi:site-specific DNA-cytosine methylase
MSLRSREYLPIATNKNQPRIWLEGLGRLHTFGFESGGRVKIENKGNSLCITAARPNQDSHLAIVERRKSPILDINSNKWLSNLKEYREVRADFHFGKITVRPTSQAFYINKGLQEKTHLEAVEIFAGGGLFGEALKLAGIHSKVALEVVQKYASVYQKAHPETQVIRADVRRITPSDVPYSDILVAGIPCTSHSNLGRASKGLAGKPETGEQGDLFIPVMNIIAAKMPAAIVFENVPNYANSLAGLLVKSYLGKLGYHIHETILSPNREWGDIQDRKRWCLVATLQPGFEIITPGIENTTQVKEFLDAPGLQDKEDAQRISRTISGLHTHFAKQKAKGNGFAMKTLNGEETKIPTIPKSYHKINQGPFIETPYGLRMLRQAELERIFQYKVQSTSYTTAVQILGQGISIGPFTQIFKQLKAFMLATPTEMFPPAPRQIIQAELF